jgi:hypothetical protein
MAEYCLDANVLIQAKNSAYGFDIVPIFWSWLAGEFESGRVVSTRSVYVEIVAGKDELAQWVKGRKHYFLVPDRATQQNYSQIANYVTTNYESPQVSHFLSGADPWVIACGLTDGLIVVTHEQRAGPGARVIKIPNICDEFDVKWTDLYTMMRKLGCVLK